MPADAAEEEVPSQWAAVYDELRSHQSLSSVTNDPRGRGIFRGQWDGLGDFWDSVRESVEELSDQHVNELEAKNRYEATLGKIDLLIGPVPEAVEFQDYLDTFTDLWEAYQRMHKAKSQAAPGRKEVIDEKAAGDAHHAVPTEYFQSDFKLEHHQIFKQSLQVSIDRQQEYNEELTSYMDLVEVSLYEHIRRAQRDRLFDSLAKLGEPIKADLEDALVVVRSFRGRLASVKKKQLRYGRAVLRLAQRKRHIAEVVHRLECLAHVHQSQPSIQMLMQGQDYVTALDLLESTTGALEASLKGLVSAKPGAQRLGKLGTTFDSVVEQNFVHHSTEAVLTASKEGGLRGGDRLRQLCACLARRGLLKATLSSTLRDVFLSQLKRALKLQVRALVEEHAQQSKEESTRTDQPSEKERPVGEGEEAANANKDGEPAAAPAPAQAEGAGAISAVLCAMGFEKFFLVWTSMMRYCLDMAKRFCDYSVLVQTAVLAPESLPFALREETSTAAAGAAAVRELGSGADVSGELWRLLEVLLNSLLQKIGALLQARQSVNASLEVSDWQTFLKFTHDSLDQVKILQDGCRSQLASSSANKDEAYVAADVRASVRGILYTQTKSIVEEFTSKRMSQMTLVLEQERWERVDVPAEYIQILDELLGKKVSQHAAANPHENQSVVRHLHVEGTPFMVVSAVLTLVQLLNSYMSLCRDFESLAAEIVQRMINLLRLFNQKTHELVLGGKAVQSEVLKRITAANLALCSQCCGLVAHILPSVQSNLTQIVEGQHARSAVAAPSAAARQVVVTLIADLSKIASDFADHKASLFTKLSDLLRERYDFHSKKWLNNPHEDFGEVSPWSRDGDLSSADVEAARHESLEGLVKDITIMYRQLLRNLTGESVRKIFAKAFEDMAARFEQRLGQEIVAPSPPYSEALGHTFGDRLAVDIAYLNEQLEKLSGIATPLKGLLRDLLRHLPTEEPLKMLHPAALQALQRSGRLPVL